MQMNGHPTQPTTPTPFEQMAFNIMRELEVAQAENLMAKVASMLKSLHQQGIQIMPDPNLLGAQAAVIRSYVYKLDALKTKMSCQPIVTLALGGGYSNAISVLNAWIADTNKPAEGQDNNPPATTGKG